jgi:hypothetical protein
VSVPRPVAVVNEGPPPALHLRDRVALGRGPISAVAGRLADV